MAIKIKNDIPKIPKAEILEKEKKLIRHTKNASDYAHMAFNYLGMAANTDDADLRLKYLELSKELSNKASIEMSNLDGNYDFTKKVSTHERITRPLVETAYWAIFLPRDHAKLSNSTSI